MCGHLTRDPQTGLAIIKPGLWVLPRQVPFLCMPDRSPAMASSIHVVIHNANVRSCHQTNDIHTHDEIPLVPQLHCLLVLGQGCDSTLQGAAQPPTHTHTYKSTNPWTEGPTDTHIQINVRTYEEQTSTRTLAVAHKHKCIHTATGPHRHTHTHTHTQTNTISCTCAHTRAHTHTHTQCHMHDEANGG